MKKVAIFHWGELSVHAYYLMCQLKEKNFDVDFFLYTPRKKYKKDFRIDLLKKLKEQTLPIEYKCTMLEACLIKLNTFLRPSVLQFSSLSANIFLPYRTRKKFSSSRYEFIITVEQISLYWLFRTDKKALSKTLHYSLEIHKVSDPHFISPSFKKILEWEQTLLKRIQGLIIQDPFRAKALLNTSAPSSGLKVFYLPVSIPGEAIKGQAENYLYDLLKIEKKKKILLYFGANYAERSLQNIINVFKKDSNADWVLVLHGPDNFEENLSGSTNIKSSNLTLGYDALHHIISSAYIGIALYDNSWPNTRYTAFSSEKIARYLQAGVPFIAFENESYLALKAEFDCCELIRSVEELPAVLNRLQHNYQHYQSNAYLAFEKYYRIEKAVLPLISYMKSPSVARI